MLSSQGSGGGNRGHWWGRCGSIAVLTLTLAGFGVAQVSENHARENARRFVQAQTGLEIATVHRQEDLEEKIRALAPPNKDNPVFVFVLSEEGYEFRETGVVYHLPSERFSWTVAVSTSSGQAFEMNSRDGLNNLASAIHLAIRDDTEAREYLYLYLDLHPEHRIFDDVVRTSLQLKQTAETQFTRAYDDFEAAEAAFDRWWKRNSEALSRASLNETFTKTNSGFLAKLYLVSGISKKELERGPKLLEVTLPISRNGQIGEPKFSPVTP